MEHGNEPIIPVRTHKTDGEYVILQEHNHDEAETWLYFIRWQGNEDVLTHLNNQIEPLSGHLLDDCSSFDIDINNRVSAITAKQMTKLELNSFQWHRKFDGVMKAIDFRFKEKHSMDYMVDKVHRVLSFGKICDYIDDEDIDTDLLTEESDTDTDDTDSELDFCDRPDCTECSRMR